MVKKSRRGAPGPRPADSRGLEVGLGHPEDFGAHLAGRMRSREWWLLVSINGSGTGTLTEIEERFYPGASNRFFELCIITHPRLGVLGVVLARKRELPAVELARCLDNPEVGVRITEEMLRKRDIVTLGDEYVPPPHQAAAVMFLDQLANGRDGAP
jgi:hypothetical protein